MITTTIWLYLSLNLLFILGFLSISCFSFILKKTNKELSPKKALSINYLILCSIILLLLLRPVFPENNFFRPTSQMWSSVIAADRGADKIVSADNSIGINNPLTNVMYVENFKYAAFILIMAIMLFRLFSLSRDLVKLFRIKKNSRLIKKIGRVSIMVADGVNVPFAYWLPGQINVVIPINLVPNSTHYKICLLHEIQHHRNNDTKWVYLLYYVRLFCLLNPVSHIWARRILELQEFACDESLLKKKTVTSTTYGRCLIDVAEGVLAQKSMPVCATGFAFMYSNTLLKRRINRMLSKPKNVIGRKSAFAFIVVAISLIASVVYASKVNSTVTATELQQMIKDMNTSSDIQLTYDESILKQLNNYVGTAKGKKFMQQSLERMKKHQSVIEAKLIKNNMPLSLLSVPLVESGYENNKQGSDKAHGAGIWMFIEKTAEAYGLNVGDKVDERLDVGLETDAAIKYLNNNNLTFNSWLLAIMAYNAGEKKVREGIKNTGSRDPWILIKKGYENDKGYLPSVVATMVIIKHPELLK